ncbi:hypothetical protein [Phyllobacterium myrsinacearum]|uniref:hypothetical protein n=1 Tax=Phyllobacterium myrsinacearum TaxID=28101 RepID=UPI00102963CB|nr:hypothetical protein [Phyllobacterium myrsinacearum]
MACCRLHGEKNTENPIRSGFPSRSRHAGSGDISLTGNTILLPVKNSTCRKQRGHTTFPEKDEVQVPIECREPGKSNCRWKDVLQNPVPSKLNPTVLVMVGFLQRQSSLLSAAILEFRMYSIDPEPYQAKAWKYIGVVLIMAALAFGLGRYYAVAKPAAETGIQRLNAGQQGKITPAAMN